MSLLNALLVFAALLPQGGQRPSQPPPKITQHEPWYTKGEQTTRPYAVRTDAVITLQPSMATFTIPQAWVNWNQQFGNNLHLTRAQLEAVARGDGEWDTEYASVCNTVLPFDRCAAHVGSEGWGKASVSFVDLQVRVYEVNDTVAAVEKRIQEDGVADIKRFSRQDPKVTQNNKASWRQTVLSYPRFYGDYGATAHVDFRIRRFDKRTVVFVFLYTNFQAQEKTIATILDSFIQ